jgi:acetyltransferase-like isoleucine patch superfamily enzyme
MGGEIKIGDGTYIDKGAILRAYGGKISIGRMCSVNPYCVLYGHGGLLIEDGVRIATHSIFIPANHIFSDPAVPIYLQGESMLGISIEEDVWIGSGVRVLDGVKIGKGSVVAAGAVVTKTLQPFGVYAGIPAKKISERSKYEEA